MNQQSFLFLSLWLGSTAFQPPRSFVGTRVRKWPSELGLVSDTHDVVDVDGFLTIASRRSFCARSVATPLAGLSVVSANNLAFPSRSYAAAESSIKLEPYNDPDYGFRIQVPSLWESSKQELSGRRNAMFFTDPNSKDSTSGTFETFGFIAYTPLRDDFTSLSSFGSVEEVAQTTILPKGELAGQTDASKMLSAVSKKNVYYFDYVVTPVVPTEPGTSSALTKTLKQQHFRTIFTLLPLKGAAGLTLVTITLQTTEERYGGLKGVFDGVVDSFEKV